MGHGLTWVRHWAAVGAAVGMGVAVAVLGTLSMSSSDRPGAESMSVPPDDATVVAVLIAPGETQHSPELLLALQAAHAAPEDRAAAQTAAALLIDEGRAAGDSRLVGAALGVLRRVMDPPEAETLYLAATARQYQHDFEGALELFDRAVELDPGHVNALLSRATLKMVLGRIAAAQEDCTRVAALRQDIGFLCQSTALIVTPQASVVGARLAQILDRPGLLPESLEAWAIGLLGEIAVLQGDDVMARARLEEMLARNPEALRERTMLADLLLRTGEPERVLPLLAEAPSTDGVVLRRALAARAIGDRDERAEEDLAERVQLNLDLGLDAHAREDAMYFLLIAGDPVMALDRALANWALQHEMEDAQLLIDAAEAAGRPDEAARVLAWMAEEGIAVPALRIPEQIRAAAR